MQNEGSMRAVEISDRAQGMAFICFVVTVLGDTQNLLRQGLQGFVVVVVSCSVVSTSLPLHRL